MRGGGVDTVEVLVIFPDVAPWGKYNTNTISKRSEWSNLRSMSLARTDDVKEKNEVPNGREVKSTLIDFPRYSKKNTPLIFGNAKK